ncbi:MAG: hypothetical protein M1820_007156 [Bogoriella megaspora]|nr:MAG: hypothetical protein M1820_007156 [Bogoriella megaspora]
MSTKTVPPPGPVHPELAQLLAQGAEVMTIDGSIDIHQMRAKLTARKRALTAAVGGAQVPANVKEKDIQVPSRDSGRTITCRVHAPIPDATPKEGSPLFVMFHGGGFCLGGLENEELQSRLFAQEGVTVLNVDYRLAPEHPFPAAAEDAWDVVKWAAAHVSELNVNPKQGFMAGGISAGGNLAAVVGHLAGDEKLDPPLTGLYLSIPTLIGSAGADIVPERYKGIYTSPAQNAHPPGMGAEGMRFFREQYRPDLKSPFSGPLAWPTGHANLPPTYFQIAELDPLRDDAVIFERMLREEEGIDTKQDFYPGLPHGFWSAFPTAAFSKQVPKDGVVGLKWLLEKGRKT